MGLGWDPARAGAGIDLDASCITFDAAGEKLDLVWFVAKEGAGGAIRHSGDNLTGEGEGDDEVITVDLGQVPPEVDVLLFTVNSYKRHPFTEVDNAYCRLFDLGTGEELVHFALTGSEPRTGVYMAAVLRSGPGWDMTGIGVFQDGRTVREMVGPAKAVLAGLDRS
jgi:stress response protein SCP2